MVYNEMFTLMPNNGFGSPTSPPDVFHEVPSPSQYSGPPSTPPSMHSPSHYTTTISPSSDSEKFESFIMKEEPMSPYSGVGYSSGTLIAGQPKPFYKQQVDEEFNMQLSSLSGHCQQQQYLQQQHLQQQQQQPPYYHQHQQQKELEQMKLHQQRFQQQVDASTHQQLKTFQGPQGKLDFVVQQHHSSDEGAITMNDADLPMWCLKVLESIVTPDSDDQQQSETNRQFSGTQQQQPQQLGYFHDKSNSQVQQLAECGQLPNLEVFTAISPNSVSLGEQNQGETSLVPNQTNVGMNSVSNIQSENESDIKIEDNSGFQFAAANAVDTIVQNGITEAGISHNPSEWSVSDVKLWFKKCSEGYGLGVFEISSAIQIDGEMLLTMSSAQFGEAIGLKEGELLRDCLSFWIARRTSQNSESYAPLMESTVANKQIKLENVDTQELMQVKQEIVSHSLLPVSVACANQAQNVSSTLEQSVCLSSFNNNSGSQSLPGHLQQSPSSQVMQHGSHPLHDQKRFQNYQQQQLYQASQNMQQHQLGQQQQFTQQQQCFTQRSVPPQNPNLLTVPNQQQGMQPTTNQSRMGSPMHGMTASPAPSPGSPAEAQMSSMMVQPAMPSSANSHPVPLQEGINGYIDESDADLSLLLRQATVTNAVQQHPATLDQDELMDTDDESDEDPPSSLAGKGGRGNSSGRTHIQLWQFLKELLNNNKRYGSCIRWIDRQEAIFKIEDSVKVATLWGERKNRPHMNYDKLSRSIRQYYNKNIMKKTARSQRLVYQFVRPYGD